jgi:hypothetical protein
MKKVTLSLILLVCSMAYHASAQTPLRYKNEVFTNSQLSIMKGIPFATNLNWLIINQTDLATPGNMPKIGSELAYLKTKVLTGQAGTIPLKYRYPKSTPPGDSTILKVTTLTMDAYMPSLTADVGVKRPVIIYLHTGNFLPPVVNGSPCGDKSDSIVVDLCKGFARRGYVAIAIDYRLGWNPIATTLDGRRGTLLNAVYRSIQDVKECVRVIKAIGANYNMDTANIALVGEGTGAYIAHAYNTLDKYPEFMTLPKFVGYIDTSKVGYIDGTRGLFNLYANSKVSTKIKVIGTLGGALADTSWLEAGDAPIVSMQCVRDPFAPFGYGIVTVPSSLQTVVDVDGANNTIMRAQRLGNNSIFATVPSSDPYTNKARSLYNKTVAHIPLPTDQIKIRSGEGMYPFLLPVAAKEFDNQASPYQWWDPTSKEATAQVAGAPAGFTCHMNSITSNTDMSKSKSKLYQDTIHGYMTPRIALAMGLLTANQLGVKSPKVTGVKIYPNPASNNITISYKEVINFVSVTDITGKVVFQSEVNTNNFTLPTLNLKSGLYVVNVATSQGNAVEKLIIK